MRKLSRQLPGAITILAFMPPIFYVLIIIGAPQNFNSLTFFTKVICGVVYSIITWLIYGIACVLAPRSPSNTSTDENPR